MKERQKETYNRQHRVRPVPTLPDDTPVWVNTQGRQVPGRVITTADTPRSYVVEVPSGQVRRNRAAVHLVQRPPHLQQMQLTTLLIPGEPDPNQAYQFDPLITLPLGEREM